MAKRPATARSETSCPQGIYPLGRRASEAAITPSRAVRTSVTGSFEERVLGCAPVTLERAGHRCAYRGVVYRERKFGIEAEYSHSPPHLSARVDLLPLIVRIPAFSDRSRAWMDTMGDDNFLPHEHRHNLGQASVVSRPIPVRRRSVVSPTHAYQQWIGNDCAYRSKYTNTRCNVIQLSNNIA